MAHVDPSEMLDIARTFFRKGDYRACEPILQRMIVSNGNVPEIYYMLGTISYDQGKFNKAIKFFQRALEIEPTYTDASIGLSIIMNDLGRYDEGKQVFYDAQSALQKKSLGADPYTEERLAVKHDELGEMYFQYKRFDEALDQYLKALKLSTRKPELTMKIVECYCKKNWNDRAMKELQRLIKEYPQFIQARLKLGVLCYNAKMVLEAVEQWEGILLRDPDHAEAKRYIRLSQEAQVTANF